MIITKDKTKEIKKELSELNDCLKMSVQRAIKIGGLLIEQKEYLGHGNFLPWLESNFDMDDRTARRYMSIYKHKNKMDILSDLQEAYKQIEQIEYQEQKAQTQKDNKILFEYKKTGIKPEGWKRRHEHLYKKMLDDSEYEKRKEAAFNKNKKESEEKNKEYETVVKNLKESIDKDDEFIEQLKKMKEQTNEDSEIKETLRLSNRHENISQEIIFESLDDYLEAIPDTSRKIETAQNIIKYLRDKIVKLQVIK